MNILMLSWRGPGHPNEGGAEQVVHEHAKAWINAGHEITLFTSSYVGAKSFENIDGIKIIRKGRQYLQVQLQAFLWYLFGMHEKFDLVVDEFHGIPFFTPLYVKKPKKFVFIHEIAGEVWKMNPWQMPFYYIPALVGPIVEYLTLKVIYKRTLFLTVSQSTKNDLIKYGIPNKNIEVINNGIKLNKYAVQKPKEMIPTILFLGAISRDKGVYDAINIFSEIEKLDDMWHFWVAGKGSEYELGKVNALIESLGLKGKVKYFGYVTEKDKFDLMARAHVFLNPSHHEGWGLVNIEANYVGTPVIGYDVSGLRDSVKNKRTGFICRKGDYKEAAKLAVNLVKDRSSYKRMVVSCINWSKNFSWQQSYKKSKDYIESI